MSDDMKFPVNAAKLPTKRLSTKDPAGSLLLHKACSHKSVIVDVKTRSLECRSCGAVVDPFDFIITLMQGDGDVFRKWKRAMELVDELSDLRRNAKSRSCKHSKAVSTRQGMYCPSCGSYLDKEKAMAVFEEEVDRIAVVP